MKLKISINFYTIFLCFIITFNLYPNKKWHLLGLKDDNVRCLIGNEDKIIVGSSRYIYFGFNAIDSIKWYKKSIHPCVNSLGFLKDSITATYGDGAPRCDVFILGKPSLDPPLEILHHTAQDYNIGKNPA